MSNITDRGTLRGVIYRGAGTGTTDYTQLSNKPQINGHTLQGNQSGDDLDLIDKGSLKINGYTLEGNQTGNDLGLANLSDIPSVPDISINNNETYYTPLKNIKLNGNGYIVYSEVFKGAKQTPTPENGKVGLVPMPIAAYNDNEKFLKGNGNWSSVKECIDYSLTEQNTGVKWIDGKYIYRKVFGDGTTHLETIDISPLNIETLIKCEGLGCDNNSSYVRSSAVWCESNVSGIYQRSMYIDTSNNLKYTKQSTGYNVYYIIIEYTKSS